VTEDKGRHAAVEPDVSDESETTEETAEARETDRGTKSRGRHRAPEPDKHDVSGEPQTAKRNRRINRSHVLAYGVLPGLALVLALATGFLKWQDSSVRDSDAARRDSVQAAKDSTAELLTYNPDTVEKQLVDARKRLTGEFLSYYTTLTNDVVIPMAKEKKISAVASVPAAGAVSADPNHAVVLAFVKQSVVVGTGVPTDDLSSVRITMDKVGGQWLISKFEKI
jgi:Mce-associated membrane protein